MIEMDVTVSDRIVIGQEPKTAGRFARNKGALVCVLLALLSVLYLNHEGVSAHREDLINYERESLPTWDHSRGGLDSLRFEPLNLVKTLAVRLAGSASVSMVLLFMALSYSVATDMKRGKILNAVTYPTMALAIGINAYASLMDQAGLPADAMPFRSGAVGLISCLLGGLTCFFLMFVSFLTAGGGGGDVKIATVIGLIVGPYLGVLALAYSYIAAGAYLFVFFAVWRVIEISKKAFRSEMLRRLFPRTTNLLMDNVISRWHQGMNGCVRMAPFFLIGTFAAVLEGAVR